MSNINNVINLNESDYQKEVLESKVPVFVDFFATWCGPCKYFTNVLTEVSPKYIDKIKFIKVDIDKCQSLAAQMRIFSVPTLMFFKDGKIHKSITGALDKESFTRELDDLIS